MKVLSTTGLTKLIELCKDNFINKTDTIDVSDALASVALSGSYNDLSNKLIAGTDISISNSNVISNTYPEVYLTDTEYQALVNAGTTDASTYYNTGSNIPGSTDDIISIRSSMNPGDTLKQGYMVLVEV